MQDILIPHLIFPAVSFLIHDPQTYTSIHSVVVVFFNTLHFPTVAFLPCDSSKTSNRPTCTVRRSTDSQQQVEALSVVLKRHTAAHSQPPCTHCRCLWFWTTTPLWKTGRQFTVFYQNFILSPCRHVYSLYSRKKPRRISATLQSETFVDSLLFSFTVSVHNTKRPQVLFTLLKS